MSAASARLLTSIRRSFLSRSGKRVLGAKRRSRLETCLRPQCSEGQHATPPVGAVGQEQSETTGSALLSSNRGTRRRFAVRRAVGGTRLSSTESDRLPQQLQVVVLVVMSDVDANDNNVRYESEHGSDRLVINVRNEIVGLAAGRKKRVKMKRGQNSKAYAVTGRYFELPMQWSSYCPL